MKIYYMTQSDNTGYDRYDACVVIAEDEDEAKCFHPDGGIFKDRDITCYYTTWANTKEGIEIEEI
jgi:hypothetical protein